jgi:hypothetical protein
VASSGGNPAAEGSAGDDSMKERGLLTQLVATIGGILHLIIAVGPFVVADHSEKPAPPPVLKAPAHPKPAHAYPKPAPAPEGK